MKVQSRDYLVKFVRTIQVFYGTGPAGRVLISEASF